MIVTGGASGLGAAICDAVAAAGGLPIVFDLNAPSATEDRTYYRVDCGDRRAIEAAIADVARHTSIDAVVANAGMDACGDFDRVDADAWERVIQVNLIGTAALVRAALPWLEQAANPRIVTIASTLGLRVLGAATAYSASKFGVVGFTRALTLDLAGRVGVTLMCPGGMKTGFFEGRDEQFKPAADALEKNQLNDPRHVAEAVLFALTRPKGVEIREMIVTPSRETSWP
ncbi:MAG: SDR family NAD(P)-dependent oxidoreductase [Candidatus Eremiobacteraeota bacterium]|nr:SDR family NAD(P)-dependent oxidoreductase [Candidatus Eremiobacteraeota bacterium]